MQRLPSFIFVAHSSSIASLFFIWFPTVLLVYIATATLHHFWSNPQDSTYSTFFQVFSFISPDHNYGHQHPYLCQVKRLVFVVRRLVFVVRYEVFLVTHEPSFFVVWCRVMLFLLCFSCAGDIYGSVVGSKLHQSGGGVCVVQCRVWCGLS